MFGAKNQVNTDPKAVEEVLNRGVVEAIDRENLRKELLSGKRLRVKLGIDPTSPHIHLGRSVPLLKLRDFQKLGHLPVVIIGNFTGLVGDTSDKDSERPMLEEKTIAKNQKTYLDQIGRVIDLKNAEVRYNADWLGDLTYREIGEQADQFSLSDFISRDNIKRRLDAGSRVSLREVLYPLMQGYDSIAVDADIELGSTDQRFNLLAGRRLQERFGKKPQNIVMTPLILGTDGRKMSSSWGNTIILDDSADEMFGKVMRLEDSVIADYLIVCTRLPLKEVEEIKKTLAADGNPKDAKMRLAREIVAMYHGKEAAEKSENQFTEVFSKGGLPENIVTINVSDGISVADQVVAIKIVESKSEWRRLQEAGAITDAESGEVFKGGKPEREIVLKIGKRRFVRIVPH